MRSGRNRLPPCCIEARMSDVVTLASALISIDSTTGHEHDAVEFVARWLITRGWNVTLQEVEPRRSNVWATRRGGGVTLSTHLDTVPPFVPPRLTGDRLYGRGACDTKGIVAAMLIAAQQMADRGEERVDLLFVVGEEKGSPGARAANRLPAEDDPPWQDVPRRGSRSSTKSGSGSLTATLRASRRVARWSPRSHPSTASRPSPTGNHC